MLGPPSDSVPPSGSRVETTLARNYLDPRFFYVIMFVLTTLNPKRSLPSVSFLLFFLLLIHIRTAIALQLLLHIISTYCTSNIIFGD